MCHVNNEKWKTTNEGRNRTTKPRKNQIVQRKGNLQILGNIGSRQHQTSGYVIKIKKNTLREWENDSKLN